MNEYSIRISNGKVIGDSLFFLLANELLNKECEKLCDFTTALDKDPEQKQHRIAEYKCAKYRYATISLVHSTVYNNNYCRKSHNIEYSRYLLSPFNAIFEEKTEHLALYESAPKNEKPDYSLYYAILAFVEKERMLLEEKLLRADDWEAVELKERIGGFQFSKECLEKAWQMRKDVDQ